MSPALRRVRRRVSAAIGRDPPRPVVRNANGAREGDCERSALIVYLPDAFVMEEGGDEWMRHQNRAACKIMASVLGDLGYEVDVIEKRDWRFKPERRYDLVVSERLDWRDFEAQLQPRATHIFLASSIEHAMHNRAVAERHRRLVQRRSGVPELRRRIYGEHAPAASAADALTGYGNATALGTWAPVSQAPAFPFNNFGFDVTLDGPRRRDFDEARRHFLFLASSTQVQKGLDLLLEIFPRHPELHLYVCSKFANEPDFCDLYRTELFETPNVHPVGFVEVNSPRFDQLAGACAWMVYPTCSDGQAGSVVQSMHAGLVPLVTPAAGIDTRDFGVLFPGDHIDEVERTVLEAAGRPPEWVRERSRLTRRAALADYSADAFAVRWREIVDEVTAGS